MTSVAAPNSNGLVISDDYIPVDAYQAIYHKITKKTERITKVFNEKYQVTFEDICNLNQRFEQGLRHLKTIKASRCEISHSTKDNYSHTYGSFDKFRISNLNVRECTSSFVYELDFLVVIDNELESGNTTGQRYKISIAFTQEFIDKEDITIPYFLRDFAQVGQMFLKIEYADYSIAQHLESIVTSWRNSLPENKPKDLYLFIMKHEESIKNILPTLISCTPLVGLFVYSISGIKIDVIIIALLALMIALSNLLRSTTTLITAYAYSNLRHFLPSTHIILTKGDKDRINGLNDKISKMKAIMAFIFFEITLSILIGLFSSWSYELFKPR